MRREREEEEEKNEEDGNKGIRGECQLQRVTGSECKHQFNDEGGCAWLPVARAKCNQMI